MDDVTEAGIINYWRQPELAASFISLFQSDNYINVKTV
jgi:hypothetical protein